MLSEKKKKTGIFFSIILLIPILFFVINFLVVKKSDRLAPEEIVLQQDEPVGRIYQGVEVTQNLHFSHEYKAAGVGLYFATYERINQGNLFVEIIDEETNRILSSSIISLEDVQDNEYVEFIFYEPSFVKNVLVRISTDSDQDNSITCWKNLNDPNATSLKINGALVEGVLCHYLIYYKEPVRFIYYLVVYCIGVLPLLFFFLCKWNPWTQIWKKLQSVQLIDWLFLSILILVFYSLFNHGDLITTSIHGKDLLTAISRGKLLDFYEFTESKAVYQLPTYILFAIWNIPTFIVSEIIGISLNSEINYFLISYWLLMWNKLLPVLFTLGSAYLIYRIGHQMNMSKDKAKWMAFIWLTFPLVLFSQFVFGQYDSFSVFFTLLSILFYLRRDLYKFSIFMAVAVTLKSFPLFIFIPLLLLVEKRFLHIAKHFIIVFSGYILFTLPFFNDPYYVEATEFNNAMIGRLFTNGLLTEHGVISFFGVTLVIVSIFAYLKKINDKKELYQFGIYIPLVIYTSLFCFILWHPQWILILTPYWVISTFQKKDMETSFYLDIVLSVFYLGTIIMSFSTNVDANLINRGAFPHIFGWKVPDFTLMNLFLFSGKIPKNVYITVFSAILLVNLFLKFPGKGFESASESDVFAVNRDLIWGRALIMLIYVIPTLWLYFYMQPLFY